MRKRINFEAIYEELKCNEGGYSDKATILTRETSSLGFPSNFDSSEVDQEVDKSGVNELRRPHDIANKELIKEDSDIKPILYAAGLSLPEELLLYTGIKVLFPDTPIKRYSKEKYKPIVNLVWEVLNIKITENSISNYICRSLNRESRPKGFGKQNGILRWHFYSKFVSQIVDAHAKVVSDFSNQRKLVKMMQTKYLFLWLNSVDVLQKVRGNSLTVCMLMIQ